MAPGFSVSSDQNDPPAVVPDSHPVALAVDNISNDVVLPVGQVLAAVIPPAARNTAKAYLPSRKAIKGIVAGGITGGIEIVSNNF